MENESEIGKGLTLESVENADVSDEEKVRMRNDLIYYQAIHAEPSIQPTENELIKMIRQVSSDD
ncbi:MAG TPA: hypothetical protein EYG73_06255 [Arcobacter sp.]|nr:hypothetical protein [Arcobacter sp.]